MSYKLNVPEADVLGTGKYKNQRGNTECVAFIQQATNAPSTALWKRGIKVATAKPGEIARGTVIATFDDDGKYPTDALGMHAAIYLSQTPAAIQVLDQWKKQGEVKPRPIWFVPRKGTSQSRSNDGNTFYVVE
jgi:hypothetical protein